MLNKVMVMGRITGEPEVKCLQESGHSITRFTVAVDKRGRDEANFIRCKAWDKTGEFVCRYFGKGRMIGIVGRLDTGNYTDADGKKIYTTDVIVDEVFFTGEKKAAESNPDGFMSVPDTNMDGLPFES